MIYVASSWRNPGYDPLIEDLRAHGYGVYDWKADGFTWSSISSAEETQVGEMLDILQHPRARAHFDEDYTALKSASLLVLLLPCGNSAHVEFGIAKALSIPTIIMGVGLHRLDLMYLGAYGYVETVETLHTTVRKVLGYA